MHDHDTGIGDECHAGIDRLLFGFGMVNIKLEPESLGMYGNRLCHNFWDRTRISKYVNNIDCKRDVT